METRPPTPPAGRRQRARPLNAFLGLAAVVVVLAAIHLASVVVTPLLLAIFLAIVCAPALALMQRRGIPDFAAILVLFSAVGVGLFLLFLALQATAEGLVEQAPAYQDRMGEWLQNLRAEAAARGIPEGTLPTEIPLPTVATVTGAARAAAAGLGQFAATAVLVLLAFVFLLIEQRHLPGKLEAAFPGQRRGRVRVRRFLRSVYRYMLIKTASSAVTGLVIGVGLAIIGVDFALLWGILAALLNFIPTVGSIVAAVPAVLVALLGLGWVPALVVVALYVATNVLIGNLAEPKFLGSSLGLSPLVVLVSLMLWGFLLGPIGMLLSVPLTMVAKMALEAHPDTRWIAVLMGEKA